MLQKLPCAHKDFTMCSGLPIRKGSDWIVYVGMSQVGNDGVTKSPLDITGCTGRCTIKEKCGDDAAKASPTVTIVDGANGIFSLYLAASDQSNLTCPGAEYYVTTAYVYDVVLEKDDEIFRVLEGSVEVSPRCTDDNDEVQA